MRVYIANVLCVRLHCFRWVGQLKLTQQVRLSVLLAPETLLPDYGVSLRVKDSTASSISFLI